MATNKNIPWPKTVKPWTRGYTYRRNDVVLYKPNGNTYRMAAHQHTSQDLLQEAAQGKWERLGGNIDKLITDIKNLQEESATALIRQTMNTLVGGGDIVQAPNFTTVNLNNISHNGIQSFLSFDAPNNQFTLQPGKYFISGSVPAYDTESFRGILYSVTNGTYFIRVQTQSSAYGGFQERAKTDIVGEIEVAGGPETFELRAQGEKGVQVFGLGFPTGLCVVEHYAYLLIQRLSDSTDINNFTPPPDPPSFLNTRSYLLDSANDFFTLPLLGLTPNDAFTYLFWIKRTGAGASNIIDTGGSGANGFALRSASNFLDFRSNGAQSGNIPATGISSGWHQIAITYDGSANVQGFKLYYDGVDLGMSLSSTTVTTVESSILVGSWSILNGSNFYIDQFVIFNTELSAAQVNNEYNSGTPVLPTAAFPANTVMYVPFEDLNLTAATDQISGNNWTPNHSMSLADYTTDIP